MKNSIVFLLGLTFMLAGCSKNYFQQTQVSSAFSKFIRYKAIVMKPVLISSKNLASEELINRCKFHLQGELSKLNFDLVNSEGFEEVWRARSFGGSGMITEATAAEVAKSMGVQALVYCDISTESIQGGLPLMATVRILGTDNLLLLYTGKARADNPASLEAGLEFAIEKALEGLK